MSAYGPRELCTQLSADVDLVLAEARAAEDGGRSRRQVAGDLQLRLHAILQIFERARSCEIVPVADAAEGHLATQIGALKEDVSQLRSSLITTDLPARLVSALEVLEFEERKDVMDVFRALLQPADVEAGQQLAVYVRSNPRILGLLTEGHARPEVALHCGLLLRSLVQHPGLAEEFLQSGRVIDLIGLVDCASFELSSDAFSSLKEVLLVHRPIAATWVEARFREFFTAYHGLLQSEAYVVQRQALWLLSEMLMDRAFMRVMLAYVGEELFLRVHMKLLKDPSKFIQLEAFHIFKLFVANPRKPPRVMRTLLKNQVQLVRHVEALAHCRPDDPKLCDDIRVVVEKVQALEPVLTDCPTPCRGGHMSQGGWAREAKVSA
jgi:calcium binding protein 39